MIVVSDTSVMTNLISIHHLHLLAHLYRKVIIPQAVYQELSVSGAVTMLQLDQPWIEVKSVADRSDVYDLQRRTQLDLGESEAIILTQQLAAELLLIDERKGRAEAQRLGLRITGLLGILVESKRKELIVAVKPLMDQLIAESTFRVSSDLYSLILKFANE